MLQQARFFYRTESGELWVDTQGEPTETRRLTFAYTFNQETGQVQYAASVHRDSDPSVPYCRVPHRDTAIGRLVKRPVVIAVDPGSRYSQVEEAIRDAMYDNGVRGPRLISPRHLEVVEKNRTLPDGKEELENRSYLVSE